MIPRFALTINLLSACLIVLSIYPLLNSTIDLIKYTVGVRWLPLARCLGFSECEIIQLARKYLHGNSEQHEKSQVVLPGFVFLLEDLIRTALTQKGITAETIFAALESSTGADIRNVPYREANNQVNGSVDLSFSGSGRFESYIFLFWVKKDRYSSALPNTTDCPVKQRCYDWANHNLNKLVVLWFSSSMFDSCREDMKQVFQFQNKALQDGIANLILLDLDAIDWHGEKRILWRHNQERRLISDALRFNQGVRFCQIIDRLRPVLLSRGSTYIKSAMHYPFISAADVPERGACFDVDYMPIPFKTFYHPYRKLCRDGTFDIIKFNEGGLVVRGMIPNSFLAASEEGHEAIVNYSIGAPYSELGSYAQNYPCLVATTRVFRMTDCRYNVDGSLIRWCRKVTWESGYTDKTARHRVLSVLPLIPDYLPEYLATQNARFDPMVFHR